MTRSDSRTHRSQQQPVVTFESFPAFNFNSNRKRESRELSPVTFSSRSSHHNRPHQSPSRSQSRDSTQFRSQDGHYIAEGIFKADGQRVYPSFSNNARHTHPRSPSRSSSNRPPFYPSPKIVSGPKSRGSSNSYSFPSGFRDFHETFYGNRDGKHKSRPSAPFRSHQEPIDNSLLGSGNFEVLSGGTFYSDDKNNFRHPYDSFLDNEFYDDRRGYNQPHTNNYVDDFFSNFRDFSEFAVRRADKPRHDDFFGDGSSQFGQALPASDATRAESQHVISHDSRMSGSEDSHAVVKPLGHRPQKHPRSDAADWCGAK